MQIKALGHVVLKVRDLERSVRFYRDVLRLQEIGRFGGRMAFFRIADNHHDLALLEVGPGAVIPSPTAVGLYHVAFKVGDSLEELRAARDWLAQNQVPILGVSDHKVSQSLYLADPDGNEIELYVDADPAIWHENPLAVAAVAPLSLS